MGLVIMAAPAHEDLDEFDICTLCGVATSLLIVLRMDQQLVSVCNDCILQMRKAWLAMFAKHLILGTDSWDSDP